MIITVVGVRLPVGVITGVLPIGVVPGRTTTGTITTTGGSATSFVPPVPP